MERALCRAHHAAPTAPPSAAHSWRNLLGLPPLPTPPLTPFAPRKTEPRSATPPLTWLVAAESRKWRMAV